MKLKISSKFSYFIDLGTKEYKMYIDSKVKETGILTFYSPYEPNRQFRDGDILDRDLQCIKQVVNTLNDVGFLYP